LGRDTDAAARLRCRSQNTQGALAFSGLPFVLCDKFSGFYSLVPPFFSLRLPVDTADVSRCVNLRPWSKSQLKFPAVSICIPGPSPASRSLRPAPSPSGSICIPGPSQPSVPFAQACVPGPGRLPGPAGQRLPPAQAVTEPCSDSN